MFPLHARQQFSPTLQLAVLGLRRLKKIVFLNLCSQQKRNEWVHTLLRWLVVFVPCTLLFFHCNLWKEWENSLRVKESVLCSVFLSLLIVSSFADGISSNDFFIYCGYTVVNLNRFLWLFVWLWSCGEKIWKDFKMWTKKNYSLESISEAFMISKSFESFLYKSFQTQIHRDHLKLKLNCTRDLMLK